MGSNLILFAFLCLDTIAEGFTHVGEPCNRIFKLCLVSNSFCDSELICRCKPNYPVNVAPHSCKKGRYYGETCDFSEECRFYDSNSYCTQLPYRSTCECYTSYVYSETKQICEAVVTDAPKPSTLILPTAIGLSLAFASILCCCMVLWHLCKRQNFSHLNFLSRSSSSAQPRHDENQMEGQNSFLRQDEALPNYDTALNLKNSEEECDPPPSYEEVISTCEEARFKA